MSTADDTREDRDQERENNREAREEADRYAGLTQAQREAEDASARARERAGRLKSLPDSIAAIKRNWENVVKNYTKAGMTASAAQRKTYFEDPLREIAGIVNQYGLLAELGGEDGALLKNYGATVTPAAGSVRSGPSPAPAPVVTTPNSMAGAPTLSPAPTTTPTPAPPPAGSGLDQQGRITANYGAKRGDPNYNAADDLNGDGVVDSGDFSKLTDAVRTDPYGAFQAAYKGSEQERLYGKMDQDKLNNSAFLETLPNELFRLLPPARLEAFSTKRLAKLPNEDVMALVRFNPNLIGGFGSDYWKSFPSEFVNGEVLKHLTATGQTGLAEQIKNNSLAPTAGAPTLTTSPAASVQPAPAGPAQRQAGMEIPRSGGPVSAGNSRNPLDLLLNLQGITPPPMAGAPTLNGNGNGISLMQTGGGPVDQTKPAPEYDPTVDEGDDSTPVTPPGTGGATTTGGPPAPPTVGQIKYTAPDEYGYVQRQVYGPGSNGVGWYNDGNAFKPSPGAGSTSSPGEMQNAATAAAKAAWDILRETALLPAQIDQILAGIGLTDAQATRLKALLPGEIAQQGATLAQIMSEIDIAAKTLGLRYEEFDWKRGLDTAGLEHRTADRALEAELGYAKQRNDDTRVNLDRDIAAGYLENTGGGQATLEREVEAAKQQLANDEFKLKGAMAAADVALKQGDQAEAIRQFDIAQALKDRIDTGRLDLDKQVGLGELDLKRQQAERDWMKDPTSIYEKAMRQRGGQMAGAPSLEGDSRVAGDEAAMAGAPTLSGQSTQVDSPAIPTPQPRIQMTGWNEEDEAEYQAEQARLKAAGLPMTYRVAKNTPEQWAAKQSEQAAAKMAGAPTLAVPESQQQMAGAPTLQTDQYRSRPAQQFGPVTFKDIQDTDSLVPGLKAAYGGYSAGGLRLAGDVPFLSTQARSRMSGTEREIDDSLLRITGNSPEDVEEERRRLSMTGAPTLSTLRRR